MVSSGNHQGPGETETQGPGTNLGSSALRRLAGNSAGLALQEAWFRLGVVTGCQPLSWLLQGCIVWEGRVLVSP